MYSALFLGVYGRYWGVTISLSMWALLLVSLSIIASETRTCIRYISHTWIFARLFVKKKRAWLYRRTVSSRHLALLVVCLCAIGLFEGRATILAPNMPWYHPGFLADMERNVTSTWYLLPSSVQFRTAGYHCANVVCLGAIDPSCWIDRSLHAVDAHGHAMQGGVVLWVRVLSTSMSSEQRAVTSSIPATAH